MVSCNHQAPICPYLRWFRLSFMNAPIVLKIYNRHRTCSLLRNTGYNAARDQTCEFLNLDLKNLNPNSPTHIDKTRLTLKVGHVNWMKYAILIICRAEQISRHRNLKREVYAGSFLNWNQLLSATKMLLRLSVFMHVALTALALFLSIKWEKMSSKWLRRVFPVPKGPKYYGLTWFLFLSIMSSLKVLLECFIFLVNAMLS